MNRRQQERVADLGRAFQEALTDVINMGDQMGMEEVMEMEEPTKSYEEPVPMPIPADLNSGLAPYEVTIRQVNNGFIVNVGCQTFAFESIDKISGYMKEYFTKPSETIEKHYAGKLFGN